MCSMERCVLRSRVFYGAVRSNVDLSNFIIIIIIIKKKKKKKKNTYITPKT